MFFTQTAQYDDFYLGDDGDFYVEGDGELAGIGSFFKKVGKIALPIAGIALNAIPGIGTVASVAINAGLSAGGSILEGAGGAGGAGGVAKGLAGITAYGNQVIAALDSVLKSGNFDDGVIQEVESLANSLSDSTKVYQPKKGKDAAALASFKDKATQKLAEIHSRAAAQPKQQQGGNVVTLANGQRVYQPDTAGGGGFDTTTILMFAGIGLGAIFLLKR